MTIWQRLTSLLFYATFGTAIVGVVLVLLTGLGVGAWWVANQWNWVPTELSQLLTKFSTDYWVYTIGGMAIFVVLFVVAAVLRAVFDIVYYVARIVFRVGR